MDIIEFIGKLTSKEILILLAGIFLIIFAIILEIRIILKLRKKATSLGTQLRKKIIENKSKNNAKR
ncbi:hypothetical protein B7939_02245 [Eggerthia catenaformis]|nr:hypothetical protein B7939_02245 [Eggerthia catenaformis]